MWEEIPKEEYSAIHKQCPNMIIVDGTGSVENGTNEIISIWGYSSDKPVVKSVFTKEQVNGENQWKANYFKHDSN